jgi:hypothetical protein
VLRSRYLPSVGEVGMRRVGHLPRGRSPGCWQRPPGAGGSLRVRTDVGTRRLARPDFFAIARRSTDVSPESPGESARRWDPAGCTARIEHGVGLPWGRAFGEVDADAGGSGQFLVCGHLGALVPVNVFFKCRGSAARAPATAWLTVAAVWSWGRLTMMPNWSVRSRSVPIAEAQRLPPACEDRPAPM